MNPVITVIIAEDHPIYRNGLIHLLRHDKEISFVAGVDDGQQLIEQAAIHNPHVVLLDLEMPIIKGAECMVRIKATHPHIKFIVLSMLTSEKTILDLVAKGCNAYLSKSASLEEIQRTIKMVVKHGHYFNEEVNTIIRENINRNGSEIAVSFSETEKKIIKCIYRECSSADIAHELSLSERTVENYRSKILHKMNVKNAAGVIRYAQEHNLLD